MGETKIGDKKIQQKVENMPLLYSRTKNKENLLKETIFVFVPTVMSVLHQTCITTGEIRRKQNNNLTNVHPVLHCYTSQNHLKT